jgi:hypothetical protein
MCVCAQSPQRQKDNEEEDEEDEEDEGGRLGRKCGPLVGSLCGAAAGVSCCCARASRTLPFAGMKITTGTMAMMPAAIARVRTPITVHLLFLGGSLIRCQTSAETVSCATCSTRCLHSCRWRITPR